MESFIKSVPLTVLVEILEEINKHGPLPDVVEHGLPSVRQESLVSPPLLEAQAGDTDFQSRLSFNKSCSRQQVR